MGDNTSIEWARHPVTGRGASWNPVLARRKDTGKLGYHCEHVSPGCINCYAETFNGRQLPNRGTGLPFKPGHRADVDIIIDEKTLLDPLRWREPRGIFVCSMTDLFGEFVPDELIDRVFAVAALRPDHVFMVLTKRPERMRGYLSQPDRDAIDDSGVTIAGTASRVFFRAAMIGNAVQLRWPLPNVWLGTSAEDQRRFDERWPALRDAPAAVRFLSIEPQIERVDMCEALGMWWNQSTGRWVLKDGIIRPDLVICGGESGPGAREFHIPWGESLLEQCRGAGIRFFMKQVGARPVGRHANGLNLTSLSLKSRKGGDWNEWPEHLRVRELPEIRP